jgi:hypothetical protein
MRSSRILAAPTALALLSVLAGCGGDVRRETDVDEPRVVEQAPVGSPEPSGPTRTRPRPTDPEPPLPSIEVPEFKRPPRSRGLVPGGDVSWPQCPKGMGIPERRSKGLPMPDKSARFVVLGLTNGPGFTRNPCLEQQVRWVRERGLMASAYAVTSFPDAPTLRRLRTKGPYDGSTRLGALRNVGYQQALFNVATMQSAGLVSPIIWVDVEPVLLFEWSADEEANAAVVVGATQGYSDAGYAVGTYSTPVLWELVVGSLSLGLPEWRAAGLTSRSEALRRCRPDWSFQGGDAVLSQWVAGSRDLDITCPGVGRALSRYFHQY